MNARLQRSLADASHAAGLSIVTSALALAIAYAGAAIWAAMEIWRALP